MFCIIDYSWIFNDTDYLFATSETLSALQNWFLFFPKEHNMFY